ncbi:5'-hydroxyaverantin dehydrogenase [Penicillium subrubescens]|uniref:5'-hydroxyaverantin dehydrogenase n=1 Tax=Penicillium subrubescens TaxID=1316194 RepID=A0A1Q5UHJ5_9EURO|nr:5'-hydroxyaverantin dehydrogenase [Penicillium subrubescens]
MPQLPRYEYTGPVDCTIPTNREVLKGKSVVVTGDPDSAPVKPKLNIVNVNLIGTMYTWKLAVHYFRKQPDTEDWDRCFIMTGSMTAWIDSPANWQYTSTKYALQGLMRTARRNSHEQGIRINYVAPCYVKSAIRSAEDEAQADI